MIDPSGVPVPGGQPTTTTVTRTVAGRIFLLNNPAFTDSVPTFLAAGHSGLVLCGRGCNTKLSKIWRQGIGPLVADPAAYTSRLATADEPVALPASDGTLFPSDLDSVLRGQRDAHATMAIVPSRYIQAGNSPAFKALVRQAQAIERDDVIVAVPVAISWLKERQYLPQLIAGLNRIPHPKAVMFGDQKNPFDSVTAIVNFRHLLADTANVGLWRADVLAAFDCLAHGGAFAAIGAGGSLRHLVPADETARSQNPAVHTPSVLLPTMLRYSTGKSIAETYANLPAPSCGCTVCAGASLDRFNSTLGEVRAVAHAHNAAVWAGWLSSLFRHPNIADRQQWLRDFCQAAIDAQDQESTRLRQKGAFKPLLHLKKLAEFA